MFNVPVIQDPASRRRMALTLLLVWLAWFIANLAAKGLFYIAAHGTPGLRLPGEVLYFVGVALTGIVIPYHLCRIWGLELPLFPEKKTVGFWIGSAVSLALAVFLGIMAIAEQGMTLGAAFSHSIAWLVAPIPIFIPTMIAYTVLWYGLMLRGWERIFGGSRWATVLAILVSAVIYGVYHLSDVDKFTSLAAVADEIFITLLIGVGFGVYVVLGRSLVLAFLINWALNWFVFTPMPDFHPPVWQWPLGLLILGGIWLIYRYGWIEEV